MAHLRSATVSVMLILLLAAVTATAAPGSACKNDIKVLTTTCYKFINKDGPKTQPSPDCCASMKDVDVPCVCNYLGTPGIRDNISLDKVFYVTKQCGVTIPGNCGGSKKV